MPPSPIKPGETITTTEPRIEIAPPLALGTHIFQLVVEDNQGQQSAPATVQVVVQKTTPDAVIKGPGKVEVNKGFALDGTGSAAVAPSKLAKFHWTLLPNVKP